MRDTRVTGVYRGICSCGHSSTLHDSTGKCCRNEPIEGGGWWYCGCAQFTAPDAELLAWWKSLDEAQPSNSRGESEQEVSESAVHNGWSSPRPDPRFSDNAFFIESPSLPGSPGQADGAHSSTSPGLAKAVLGAPRDHHA